MRLTIGPLYSTIRRARRPGRGGVEFISIPKTKPDNISENGESLLGTALDQQHLAFLFVGGETEKKEDSRVEINTAVGTLGVRGTIVWGGPIDGSFGVLVSSGRVTVRNEAGEVSLGAGEGTMIDAVDAAPSAPKTWPMEKVRRALQTVSFEAN